VMLPSLSSASMGSSTIPSDRQSPTNEIKIKIPFLLWTRPFPRGLGAGFTLTPFLTVFFVCGGTEPSDGTLRSSSICMVVSIKSFRSHNVLAKQKKKTHDLCDFEGEHGLISYLGLPCHLPTVQFA
jgi:hypothetical protein